MDAARRIRQACRHLEAFLVEKSESYGDSVGIESAPLRVFSRASGEDALRVRLDDKLSRLARGQEHGQDDTLLDIAGYLVLLLAARGYGGDDARH